ncbi:autophagy protein 16 [Sodiomyces alkalinus F11]|uniref:Autophagy protein 16 n=1 Tax=Sodiomyces alkalinus (strain CBS 110278 / VKM F-3762 / F11) TaxID=1314773 RepID=A0A3N2PVD7_SODAK|nr:autophagy protein 16 [Sodiomyces alkalinus F11]ROT38452.1 autophagy protein 16 [Sodiomyces alkalinus F11]
MPGWRDEYLASLREQERNNPVNLELVDLCSQLADRIAALEAEKDVLAARAATTAPETRKSNKKSREPPPSTEDTTSDPAIAQLRLDLAESLRSRGALQTRLKKAEDEVADLRAKNRSDARRVKELSADRAVLITKLRDREDEIREKRKLIENVQDEMIALNLHVAMAEKERDKVKKENAELVDRWMKRMAQEAEAMNLANEPHFERKR